MTVRSVARLVGSLVGAAGTAACLTLLSLGMRSVLNVGGTCASGNTAYVIRVQCPTGIAWIMPVAIWVGLLSIGLFVVCAPEGAKGCSIFAWTALFGSLGWNFLQNGLPIDGHGFVIVWLLLGIMFIVMGITPLFWTLPPLIHSFLGRDEETPVRAVRPAFFSNARYRVSPTPASAGAGPMFAPPSPPPRPSPPTGPPAGLSADLTAQLERLAVLHRKGDLSDAEYESAKKAVLPRDGWS